jgi:hypothetical protein
MTAWGLIVVGLSGGSVAIPGIASEQACLDLLREACGRIGELYGRGLNYKVAVCAPYKMKSANQEEDRPGC